MNKKCTFSIHNQLWWYFWLEQECGMCVIFNDQWLISLVVVAWAWAWPCVLILHDKWSTKFVMVQTWVFVLYTYRLWWSFIKLLFASNFNWSNLRRLSSLYYNLVLEQSFIQPFLPSSLHYEDIRVQKRQVSISNANFTGGLFVKSLVHSVSGSTCHSSNGWDLWEVIIELPVLLRWWACFQVQDLAELSCQKFTYSMTLINYLRVMVTA